MVDARNPRAALERDISRIEVFADTMDRKYIDPLLGLVFPGVGDSLGALLGLYTVYVAFRARVPTILLVRMIGNLAIDALLGTIPVLGVVFDFVYQANMRNLRLLKARLESEPQLYDHRPLRANTSDYVTVGLAVLLFLVVLLLPVVLAGLALVWLLGQI